MPLLDILSVSKFYRRRQGLLTALKDVSVQLEPGDFVAVKGPSGCGKTTLLLAAGGLLAPNEGAVRLDGQDLYALSPEARARLRAAAIGFVFQQFHLIPYLSVLDNVLAASLAAPTPDARRRAEQLLDELKLSARLSHMPSELSTGERQRVALARALLTQPQVVLADEPTGNLDEENARAVMEHLGAYAAAGAAVLTVTHDPNAAVFAQRVLALEQGRLATDAAARR